MSFDLTAFAKWLWEALTGLLQTQHGAAVLLGISIGVLLAETLAHCLPPAMDSYYADRLTRLTCFGVSLTSTFSLDASLHGFFLAVLAGLAGPTLHGVMLRYIAARWPSRTPQALIPGPCDDPPPRPLIPRRPDSSEP